MRRSLACLAAAFWLSACTTGTPRWVLPREDGTISAVSVAREESTAAIACIDEANNYCKERARRAVFLNEQTEYQGVLTERGGGIARVIKNIPGVGDKIASDEDYRVTTRFKCVPLE